MACGVCVIFLGTAGAMEKMLSAAADGTISSVGTMTLIASLVLGALIGEIINIEAAMERFGTWLRKVSHSEGDGGFVGGFVNASLTVCVGAMAVVGSIQDGILGDHSTLFAKAVLDLIIVMVMTAASGKGCIFSAIPVAIFQGTITALSNLLEDVMNRQGEDFYYMHTLIEVTASDPETLEHRVTAVEKLCVSVDMIARRCEYKQEQAFLSMLPILYLDPDIERKSRRNALTSGVAAAFPFASYELSDRNGIFLGLNMYNRSPVFLNPYDDYKYTNGNIWIGGSSGAGKTFTLQCVGGRLRQQGKRVIYIIPKKGHEFRPRCEQLGGLYLRMSPSSPDCPNIMAIRRKSLDTYAGLKGLASRDDSVLADKISRLIIWYSLQKRDLSDEDRNYLDTSLVECYRRYGITFDNTSVLNEDGSFREMPVLADWYDVLQERADTRHLAVVLARYVTGSASAMGSRNEIDLDNKYIVIDTSGMPDDLLLPGIFWATDIANDLISSAGGQLSALISDELWSLVGANSNPLAAGYIQEMVKTIRGLGGIAITSTQGMQDLFSLDNGKYGKGILDSSRIKIVMQMEEQEARLIQNVLNLSEEEVRQITRFRRGEGLLCIGYNHVPIAFYATQKEYDAITTSPTDLLKRKEQEV